MARRQMTNAQLYTLYHMTNAQFKEHLAELKTEVTQLADLAFEIGRAKGRTRGKGLMGTVRGQQVLLTKQDVGGLRRIVTDRLSDTYRAFKAVQLKDPSKQYKNSTSAFVRPQTFDARLVQFIDQAFPGRHQLDVLRRLGIAAVTDVSSVFNAYLYQLEAAGQGVKSQGTSPTGRTVTLIRFPGLLRRIFGAEVADIEREAQQNGYAGGVVPLSYLSKLTAALAVDAPATTAPLLRGMRTFASVATKYAKGQALGKSGAEIQRELTAEEQEATGRYRAEYTAFDNQKDEFRAIRTAACQAANLRRPEKKQRKC